MNISTGPRAQNRHQEEMEPGWGERTLSGSGEGPLLGGRKQRDPGHVPLIGPQ